MKVPAFSLWLQLPFCLTLSRYLTRWSGKSDSPGGFSSRGRTNANLLSHRNLIKVSAKRAHLGFFQRTKWSTSQASEELHLHVVIMYCEGLGLPPSLLTSPSSYFTLLCLPIARQKIFFEREAGTSPLLLTVLLVRDVLRNSEYLCTSKAVQGLLLWRNAVLHSICSFTGEVLP